MLLAMALVGCVETADTAAAADTKAEALDPRCALVPDPGLCKAYIPAYYFDAKAQSCQEFIWGGCGGVVPFKTLDECRAACPER